MRIHHARTHASSTSLPSKRGSEPFRNGVAFPDFPLSGLGLYLQLSRRYVMNRMLFLIIGVALFFPGFTARSISAANAGFASWNDSTLILDNGNVRRIVSLGKAGKTVSTDSLTFSGSKWQFIRGAAHEFSLEADGKLLTGSDGLEITGCHAARDSLQGQGATIALRTRKGNTPSLEIELTWLLYPDLPVIRKRLAVRNTGSADVRLEAVDMEVLSPAWEDTHAWCMGNYARNRRLGPFTGNWEDCAVIVHNIQEQRGIMLGNEAPGVMKRTTVFLDGQTATIGLTRPGGEYPFRKWLKSGEQWESPSCFTAIYRDSADPWTTLNGPVSDFVRRHMGIRLAAIPEKPVFVYNTWNPFRTDLNEGLIRELAEAAAKCGVEEFVIDDGWQINRGDWQIDKKKFPHGLKPVFEHIASLGMKPGLWISLATAETSSAVFREHPEWFVKNREGKPSNLHFGDSRQVTACLATGWYDHIKSVILGLVREHGLAYVKLDLSIVTSAYVYDRDISGCYATDHPLHRDREESFLTEYQRCMDLFDDLHREAPNLFIDCTFETWGALQLIDYTLVKHAEGDWLSNIEEPMPWGSLRARNLAWSRTPAIPAGALVIGNLTLDDPARETGLLSLAGSLPIMLGDPRKIPDVESRKLRQWANWMRAMEKKHGYFLFRQDLPGFGEPVEGHWDGWARINTDTGSGGIFGVFRQGGAETERTVTIPGLVPDREYSVRRGPDGYTVGHFTGKELTEKGFRVRLPEKYSQELFEVEKEDPKTQRTKDPKS